jgi:hypothetical protein
MWIRPKSAEDRARILAALGEALKDENCRFHWRADDGNVASHHWQSRAYRHGGAYGIKIDRIRLKFKSRHWCGQHPGPCPVNGFPRTFGAKGAHLLEGADWVGFNDFLNSVLDRLGVEAGVFSYNREAWKCNRYYIRRDRRRLVRYRACYPIHGRPELAAWLAPYLSDYEDWCGKEAPCSEYPHGTPGYAGRTVTGEREHALAHEDEEEAAHA